MIYWPGTNIVKSLNNDFNYKNQSSSMLEDFKDLELRKKNAANFVNKKRLEGIDPLNIGSLSEKPKVMQKNVSQFAIK